MNPIDERKTDLQDRIAMLDVEGGWDERSELEYELSSLMGEDQSFKVPTLATCVEAVGEPAEKWVSRCSEIACKILEELELPGESQYGFYYGPIHLESMFHPRAFVRHGWVLLADGRIFDPTRWTLDSPNEPYIYCLHPDWHESLEYDMGMNRYKAARLRPPPKPGDFADSENGFQDKERKLPLAGEAREFVRDLFDEIPWQPGNGAIVLTEAQLFWLGNYPYHLFGDFAEPVYQAMKDVGRLNLVPMDNREAVGVTT